MISKTKKFEKSDTVLHFNVKLVRRKLNPHLCFGMQSVKCIVLVEL